MTTSIDKLELVTDASLNIPDVARLTTQHLDGTGVFDVLMKTTKMHIIEEYNSGRITGEEYSSVYMSALNGVMSASIQFLLNYQQEEKIQSEIALIRQQTATELANTDDTIPLGLGFNGTEEVEGMVKLQKDKLLLEQELATSQIALTTAEVLLTGAKVTFTEAQAALAEGQVTMIPGELALLTAKTGLTEAEVLLTDAKVDLTAAEISLTDAKIVYSVREGDYMGQKVITELATTSDNLSSANIAGLGFNLDTAVQGVTRAQIDKIEEEIVLTEQKVTTELAQTSDIKPIELGVMDTTVDIKGIAERVRDKTDAEQLLLRYKGTTEVAQTMDTVPSLHVNGVLQSVGSEGVPYPVGGVIGKQKDLFNAQTQGYARDAEQKAAKILTETWSIDASMGDATRTSSNHLEDPDVGSVIAKLKTGISA